MRAWNAGAAGGADRPKSPPAREEEAEGGKKRALEEDVDAAKGAEEVRGRGAKESKKEASTAKDMDNDLRAFFDGKAALKGTSKQEYRSKKFGGDAPAKVAKEPTNTFENDAEKAEKAAKELEAKMARAKRFGIVNPELEAQEKRLQALKENAKNAEEKAIKKAKDAEEKDKLDAEAKQKKLERAKRFGLATKETASDDKPADAATEKDAKATNGEDKPASDAPTDKEKEEKDAEAKQKKLDRAKRFGTATEEAKPEVKAA